jgi:hypothetical protein
VGNEKQRQLLLHRCRLKAAADVAPASIFVEVDPISA